MNHKIAVIMYSLQDLTFLKNLPTSNSKIGVLGGSFDPAHIGHLQISLRALKKFKMDYVVWLVANQNPFKPAYRSSIQERATCAAEFADHPKILVTTLEQEIGTFYSYHTITFMKEHFPNLNLTWLMGIDNLAHFDKWYKSDQLAELMNFIVFDRPTTRRFTNHCRFLSKLNPAIAKSAHPHIIVDRGALCPVSSTAIKSK